MKPPLGFFVLLFGWAAVAAAQEHFTDRLSAAERKARALAEPLQMRKIKNPKTARPAAHLRILFDLI